jgi:hypothetical protein
MVNNDSSYNLQPPDAPAGLPASKLKVLREHIKCEITQYLNRGGTIQQIPIGISAASKRAFNQSLKSTR